MFISATIIHTVLVIGELKFLCNYDSDHVLEIICLILLGGKKRNLAGDIILLKRRVLTPMWYWKAVCDPVAQQSIVFVGENAVGDASNTHVAGCNGIQQTKSQGVIYCYSLNNALKAHKQADFKLPPFHEKNCNPAVRGAFMDNLLINRLS